MLHHTKIFFAVTILLFSIFLKSILIRILYFSKICDHTRLQYSTLNDSSVTPPHKFAWVVCQYCWW